MASITHYRGAALGRTQSIYCGVPIGEQYSFFSERDIQTRPGRLPTHRSTTIVTREIPIIIRAGSAAGTDGEVWERQMLALFDPDLEAPGMLRIMHEGVAMEAPAFITNIELHPQSLLREGEMPIFKGVIQLVDPYWRAVTAQTAVSPTLTLTMGGNRPAQTIVTLRPTTGTVVRKRITITEVTGRGLTNHWYRIASFSSTGVGATAPTNFLVFDRLMSVPFFVQGYNTGTTVVDILLNLKPYETITIDIVFGSAVSNTITANMLDPSGFDIAHASFSNTSWIYRNTAGTVEGKEAKSMWQVSRNIPRPGVWHHFKYGAGDVAINNTDLAASAVVSPQIAFGVVTQIKTAASNAVQNMDISDSISGSDGSIVYKVPRSYIWQTAAITRTGTFPTWTTDDFQIPGANAFGIVAGGISPSATVSQEASPIQVNLDASEVPTQSAAANVTMARLNGTLTNTTTGQVIRCNDLFIDADAAGGLVIDYDGDTRVRPSLSTSPMYWPGKVGYQVDKKGWPLVVGVNNWVWAGDGTPVITVQARAAYAV